MVDPIKELLEPVARALEATDGTRSRIALINAIKAELHKMSPLAEMPVDNVRWVPIEMVEPNDYNPNSVAPNEMRLLHTSISHDGYTQPVVAIWDEEKSKFVIVDGFHRYTTCRVNADIQQMTHGMVPLVVIEKSINDRMASTIRHNRARGKHSMDGMAEMVFSMLDEGWKDEDICNEIGVSPEELVRLKHVTGFSYLFENAEYKLAWQTARQARYKRDYEKGILTDGEEADADADDQPGATEN